MGKESSLPEKYAIRSLRDPTLFISFKYEDLWTSDRKKIRTWPTFDDAERHRTTKLEPMRYGTEVCYLGAL